jgi:hypothetical protein
MMAMLARLGHVIFLIGLLLAILIVLGTLGLIVWNVGWEGAGDLLTLMKHGDWRSLLEWLWGIAKILIWAVMFSLVPLLIGVACCYVLGGFSAPPQSR